MVYLQQFCILEMSLIYSTLPWCKDAEDLVEERPVMSDVGDEDSSQLRDVGIQDPDDEKFIVEYVIDKRIGKKGWWAGKVSSF